METCGSLHAINRGSNMSAHFLFYLLNELSKREKDVRFAEHFIFFRSNLIN